MPSHAVSLRQAFSDASRPAGFYSAIRREVPIRPSGDAERLKLAVNGDAPM
jgi:hypothetical protein